MTADRSMGGRLSFGQRIDALRSTKLQQTKEKQEVIGAMDYDDWALVLPPPARRKLVQVVSSSGANINDCLLAGYEPVPNHPSGGFFGPKAVGRNFRALLDAHPTYIDPVSSLAGCFMVNFNSYRSPQWNPDLDYSDLKSDHDRYKLHPGIGALQHFCQDMGIGLELGWRGLLDKIRYYRLENAPLGAEFYDGLEETVLGMQDWIRRHAEEAHAMAQREPDPQLRANLMEIAEINARMVDGPPRSFRDACQWILWYQDAARMFNGSGSLGRLDLLLLPFYERDKAAGVLTDEEAVFHIACYLVRDTAYMQLGGPDMDGNDVTNRLSYLILEAAHQLKIPANIGVCVGDRIDPNLLRRGVEIMLEDRTGIPKFLGIDRTSEGFSRNGYPMELARQRAYAGCHWSGLPGREYTMNDCVKINLAAVFEVALTEMLQDSTVPPSVERLWSLFVAHLRRAVGVIAEGLDFHMAHAHDVFPELMLDLLCYGPIEKGLDATNDGLEYYNLCVDGAALATVADSLAACEQRIERDHLLTWQELSHLLETDWSTEEGERMRVLMNNSPRFGRGGSVADDYAVRISREFARIVKEKPTPAGFNMIPGLFSWAFAIQMGWDVGPTPNGRKAKEPISHGANPYPGFRRDGAPTALALAVASVQPGFGNTGPMQIELDPSFTSDDKSVDTISSLIRSHFALGGTQINMNLVDAAKILEAHNDPSKHPDLIVRVTGFSAYFASLSPQLRRMVVDRILTGD